MTENKLFKKNYDGTFGEYNRTNYCYARWLTLFTFALERRGACTVHAPRVALAFIAVRSGPAFVTPAPKKTHTVKK
jgi:hypothetical protein